MENKIHVACVQLDLSVAFYIQLTYFMVWLFCLFCVSFWWGGFGVCLIFFVVVCLLLLENAVIDFLRTHCWAEWVFHADQEEFLRLIFWRVGTVYLWGGMVNVHLRICNWVPYTEYMGWTGLKNGQLNATMRSQHYFCEMLFF